MAEIKQNVTIKVRPEKVYEALTSQKELASWWTRETTAKSEVGFVNVFIFGNARNEMKVTRLTPDKNVEWRCINSSEEWIGTDISFDLQEKGEHTVLRFTHGGWREMTDFFASCTYGWAMSIQSLKSFCETGTGKPS
jgi:uncharacterized protein YndB with AHSA1/START domain